MSKDVSSIMREVAEKIKSLDFSKLAEYLIAKKEMGVSSKLLTAALTENIHLLGEKIKSESPLMYVSFLFKLEQAKVIPNRLEFFRATLPSFVEVVSKKRFHFIALVEFLCKYKLLGELKLLMKALKKVESLPFKSAGEILHVLERLIRSLAEYSVYVYSRKKRFKIGHIPITYASEYEIYIVFDLVETSILKDFLEHKYILNSLTSFSPEDVGNILVYYLVFYLAKIGNSPKAISSLIKLVNKIYESPDKNVIYGLFKGFQRGVKLFKDVAFTSARDAEKLLQDIKRFSEKTEEFWNYVEKYLIRIGFIELYFILTFAQVVFLFKYARVIDLRTIHNILRQHHSEIFDNVFDYCINGLVNGINFAKTLAKRVAFAPAGLSYNYMIKEWRSVFRLYEKQFVKDISTMTDDEFLDYLNFGDILMDLFFSVIKSAQFSTKEKFFERILRMDDEKFERFLFIINLNLKSFLEVIKPHARYYRSFLDRVEKIMLPKVESLESFIDYIKDMNKKDLQTTLALLEYADDAYKKFCEMLSKLSYFEIFDLFFNKLIIAEDVFYAFLESGCVWKQFLEKYRALKIDDMISILAKNMKIMRSSLIITLLDELHKKLRKAASTETFDLNNLLQFLMDVYEQKAKENERKRFESISRKIIECAAKFDFRDQITQMNSKEFFVLLNNLSKIGWIMKIDKQVRIIQNNSNAFFKKILDVGIPAFINCLMAILKKYSTREVFLLLRVLLDTLASRINKDLIRKLPEGVIKKMQIIATTVGAKKMLRMLKI